MSGPARQPGVVSVGEPVLQGDAVIGAVLGAALLASGEVDRGTHGFHTWPAGLHPDAAALVIEAFPGRSVLDPFCGGGTVLVEARIAGRVAIGRDVSPIALMVASGRATTWTEEQLTRARSAARKATELAQRATEQPPEQMHRVLQGWYHPHVLAELESLRRSMLEADEEIRPILRLCFSSILVKTSFRVSDTSARRQVRDRPRGTTSVLFHKKVREYGRRVAALRELVPEGTPAPHVARGDARRLSLRHPVQLALTSPPYPSTYDYLPLQLLRSVWLGLEEGQGEIGSRRSWRKGEAEARRRWADDTIGWTRKVAAALEPGGHLVVVVGDGLTPSGAVDALGPTLDAGRAAGMELVARATVGRRDHAREAERLEHAVAFRRAID
ncbi:MAG: hypothetical protein KC621_00150 [Myxococcales bacterium]|nr:hypothetical protein [Myxococcales bacterium]